jgi:hypothetical protein
MSDGLTRRAFLKVLGLLGVRAVLPGGDEEDGAEHEPDLQDEVEVQTAPVHTDWARDDFDLSDLYVDGGMNCGSAIVVGPVRHEVPVLRWAREDTPWDTRDAGAVDWIGQSHPEALIRGFTGPSFKPRPATILEISLFGQDIDSPGLGECWFWLEANGFHWHFHGEVFGTEFSCDGDGVSRAVIRVDVRGEVVVSVDNSDPGHYHNNAA